MKEEACKMKSSNKYDSSKFIEIFLNNKAIFILILMVLIAQPITRGMFFSYANFSSVARQISTSLMIALGYTVLLGTGSMDLSSGNMVSLLGIVFALCTLRTPLIFAVIITIVCGCMCGFLNGYIAMKFRLAPFILTLATGQIYNGLASLICGGTTVAGLSSNVKFIGQGLIFGVIPISILFALAVALVISILVGRTKYGRHVLATGGNKDAARVSGINTFFIKVSGFVALGLCCALGAIVLTGRVGMAVPSAGDLFTLDSIAAVAIGGTPMHGGKAKVGGTIVGCIIIGIISNILNLCGVSVFLQWIAKGVIIVVAILLDSGSETFFKEQQRKASAV